MILVDTSVWINFLRVKKHAHILSQLLLQKQVLCHPWILGELMLGDLGPKRIDILSDLDLLPKLEEYSINEIRKFIEEETLYSKGLSLIDIQLLYACLVEDHVIWTDDRTLEHTAKHYGKTFKRELILDT